MALVLVLLTLGLAFANGANDVSKGIATLVGSGTTRYRAAAVTRGTLWTVAGGLTAAFLSQAGAVAARPFYLGQDGDEAGRIRTRNDWVDVT
jgi:phosphate/sulfate permease